MGTTIQELSDFHRFAVEQISNGGGDLSLEELLDYWRLAHPKGQELRESLGSLKRGLEDIVAGRVHPAREVIEELRQGLPAVSDA